MKTRKIAIIAATLLLALALPAFSIPQAKAYPWSGSLRISGVVLTSYSDPFLGSVNYAAREGSTVNFNVEIITDSSTGQRNVTVGVKMDWSNAFANSSSANPAMTMAVQPSTLTTALVAVSIPAVSGFYSNINLWSHTWELRVWNGPLNTPVTYSGCPNATCQSFSGSGFAVYSNAQADGVLAKRQSQAEISSLQSTLGGLLQLPPGAAKASSEIAQAASENSQGDTSYSQGDFATAKTHYTNALNLANSAASDLSTQGGGVDSAAFWQLLLNGTGVLLVGVGVVVAAVGSWMYLRKRSKAAMLK